MLVPRAQGRVQGFFFPLQAGVGQPLGTEEAFQIARQWRARNVSNLKNVFMKVVFIFLGQCQQHFPGIACWTAAWYCTQPSSLLPAGRAIPSESGLRGSHLSHLFVRWPCNLCLATPTLRACWGVSNWVPLTWTTDASLESCLLSTPRSRASTRPRRRLSSS